MGMKYIIELPENTHWIQWLMEGTEDHHPYMDFKSVEDLKPYTKLDLEQVRKEAYDKGYHEGHNACFENAKDLMEEKKNEAYQRGLDDAWEAARKIHRMPDGDIIDLFPDCYASVCTAAQAILKYDASEAIDKIKEYEDGKQEIKVGDEVERILDGEVDSKAVFLEEDEGYYHCLFWTGCCFTTLGYPKKQFRKTGRHFTEIDTVIEKMRGDQE